MSSKGDYSLFSLTSVTPRRKQKDCAGLGSLLDCFQCLFSINIQMCEYKKVNVLENILSFCSFIVCMHFYINLFQNEAYFIQTRYVSKTTVLVNAQVPSCCIKTMTWNQRICRTFLSYPICHTGYLLLLAQESRIHHIF